MSSDSRASLKEYFPQAIELCNDNLASRLATDFVAKWPTLEAFQQAKPSALKKFYYGHNIRSPEVIEKVLSLATTAQTLTIDSAIVESAPPLNPAARSSYPNPQPAHRRLRRANQRDF